MKNIFLFFLLLSINNAEAQSAEFEMTFYFEDAVGNKDSLVLGYDADASYTSINSLLGEVAITTPFDSVFEVRAYHYNDPLKRTSKKIIENYDTNSIGCIVTGFGMIVPVVKHPPLLMYYDKTKFNNFCYKRGIILFNNNLFEFLGPLELSDIPEYTYYCLGGSDTITISNAVIDTCINKDHNYKLGINTLS